MSKHTAPSARESTSTAPTAPKIDKRIPGLDGLRAISILMVIIYHNEVALKPIFKSLNLPANIIDFLGNGHIGVVIFFVISGYLITTLLKRELERTNTISLKDFYTRRAYRIFPAYYFYLGVIAILAVAGFLDIRFGQFIIAGTYTWNYLFRFVPQGADTWYLVHFWTLAIEEQFYLLWPLTLLWLRPKKAAKLAVFLICLTPFIRVFTHFVMPEWRFDLPRMLHTQWDPLMMGALIALWEGEKFFEDRIRPLINNRWLLLLACITALFIVPLLDRKLGNAFGTIAQVTIEIICIALVLLHVTRNPTTTVGKFLNHPAVVFVGTLSYSLYLWHQLFTGYLNQPWKTPFPGSLLSVVACSLISYYLIEQPFLRLRHTLAARAKKRDAQKQIAP